MLPQTTWSLLYQVSGLRLGKRLERWRLEMYDHPVLASNLWLHFTAKQTTTCAQTNSVQWPVRKRPLSKEVVFDPQLAVLAASYKLMGKQQPLYLVLLTFYRFFGTCHTDGLLGRRIRGILPNVVALLLHRPPLTFQQGRCRLLKIVETRNNLRHHEGEAHVCHRRICAAEHSIVHVASP